MMEYGNVAIMGASATQLGGLDTIQNATTKLCHTSFVPLQCRRHAASVGLLLKLLDDCCRELLQTFCPDFSTSHLTLCRSSRLATSTQPYLLADIIVYNLFDLFRWSFLGSITIRYGRTRSRFVCVNMAILLDGKLYVKTFSILYVDYSRM